MEKIHRKILLAITLIIFFIITPILIFYATGYRFDFKTKSLKKIGMLILESKPQNVKIFLDEKLKSEKSPHKIKNLFPGDYHIKIIKENFDSWEKTLTVKPKEINWVSNIVLFFIKPEGKNISTLTASDFSINSYKDKIAYIVQTGDEKGIWLADLEKSLINLKTEKENKKIFPQKEDSKRIKNYQNINLSEIQFFSDDKKILFTFKERERENQYGIIDLSSNSVIFLSDFSSEKIENIKIDKDSKDVFFTNQDGLYKFNVSAKKITAILNYHILNYDTYKNQIFYVIKNKKGNKNLLYVINKNNEEKSKLVKKFKTSNKILLKINRRGNIAYLDYDNSRLYLFNNDEFKLISNEKINDLIWSKKGKKLLYFNDNEIWFYAIDISLEKEKWHPEYKFNSQNLVTRLSEKIENPAFYDEEHIAFLQNDILKIAELDERDKRNIYETKIKPNAEKFFFDKNGEDIYFIDDDTKNLIEIKITEK